MKQQVSLREANQHLSRYIAAAERGEEVVITRRGKPIAKLVKVSTTPKLTSAQKAARERMLTRMTTGYRLGGEVPARESLHER
jgi:prevent-host-death family protein